MRTPSIHLQSLQAESLVRSALDTYNSMGKLAPGQAGKLQRDTLAFFKTANDSKTQSNALLAFVSAVNNVRNFKDLTLDAIFSAIEKHTPESTQKEVMKFFESYKANFERSLPLRRALMDSGRVRVEAHKPTFTEKLLSKIFALKEISFSDYMP